MTAPLPVSPIGIYDSGVGGLSVLRAIREALPSESLLYVADSAHVPYGEKSQAFVEQRALTMADYFVSRQAKAMVVACNTATAAAIAQVRRRHPNLIVIGVEPAIKPAAHLTHSGVVGVFATTGTLASPKFATLVQREAPEVRILLRPCPEWVRLVEAGELTGPTVQAAVAAPVEELRAAGADVLVLGCTHFPFLRDAIQAAAGPGVPLLETGAPVARWLRHQLQERALLRPPQPDGDAPAEPNASAHTGTGIDAAAVLPPDPGLLRLETTGSAPALAALASRLLDLRVDAFVTPERWR